MAIWPWYGALVHPPRSMMPRFLQVQDYKNVIRWMKQVGARPAVERGKKMVNRTFRQAVNRKLRERHVPATSTPGRRTSSKRRASLQALSLLWTGEGHSTRTAPITRPKEAAPCPPTSSSPCSTRIGVFRLRLFFRRHRSPVRKDMDCSASSCSPSCRIAAARLARA